MPQSLEKRGMRRWGALAWSAALVAGLLLQGAALAQETRSGQTVALKIPKCASPAKRIMIGTVSCRAAACNAPDPSKLTGLAAMVALAQAQESGGGAGGIAINGDGVSSSLAAMLSSSLKQSGCFEVFDREGLDEVKKAMEQLGRKFEMPEVDLLISGAITSVSITRRATQVLLVKSVTQSAELSFDSKAIDARTGAILSSGTFSGQSDKSATGVELFVARTAATISGTPLEEVAREAIMKATAALAEQFARERIVSTVDVALPR